MKIVRMAFRRSVLMTQEGISSHLLKEMLDLMPSDTKFVGCGEDSSQHLDYLFFSSDTFTEVPQGSLIPEIYPQFRRYSDGSTHTERIDWGNSQSSARCSHIWTTHSGLRDSYDYCTLCNTRRNP